MCNRPSLLIRTASFLLLVATIAVAAPPSAVATVSGDNGKISFVSDRDGNPEIYVMATDGSDLVNLTINPASDTAPSWSPDGRQIAFVSDRDGDSAIFVMNSDGSNVDRLALGSDPAWSPDGARIAFARESDIFVINVDGSGLTRITDSDAAPPPFGTIAIDDMFPAWSPDGSRLAFIRHYLGPSPTAQTTALYVIAPRLNQTPQELISLSWATNTPDWSPSGAQLAATEIFAHHLHSDVFLVGIDGSRGEALAKPQGFTHIGEPAWSPDGARLAIAAYIFNVDHAREIFIMSVDGTGTPINVTNNPASDTDPAWQPLNPYPAALVDPATGIWHLRNAMGEVQTFYYGNPGDVPFMGDWDGDGVATPGLYRRSDGYVYLRNSNTQGIADIRFFFGNPGDVPLAGDFDGDGYDTVSLFRPSEQQFYVINRLGSDDSGLGAADFAFIFGNPGDEPFVGDFDGDGSDEIGLHRDTTGRVYLRFSLTSGIADLDFVYGNPRDQIVAGDWNGDGTDTPALFRPSNTTHYFRFTNSTGIADAHYIWGESDWLPVTGSFELA